MIITREQQEALVDNYIKEGHKSNEVIGFIDGMGKAIELIIKLKIREHESRL